MPRNKVNPFLLMPDLSEVGKLTPRKLEDTGRDFVETMDQIDPDCLGDESLYELNEFVDIMRGEKD